LRRVSDDRFCGINATQEGLMLAKLPDERQAALDVATYIEDHGWCQSRLRSVGGAVCIMGALHTVRDDQSFWPAYQFLYGFFGGEPAYFNDAKGRTKDEIVAALRAAALHGL
jgi:hypothetical protein